MSELTDVFGDWFADTDGTPLSVVLRPSAGPGAFGASVGAPITVTDVMVVQGTRLVRGSDGNQKVSSATILLDIEHEHADAFTLNSEVDLSGPNARTTTVLQIDRPDVFGVFGFVMVRLE